MLIREKMHRLPREYYRGKIFVAFTLCLNRDVQAFSNSETMSVFTDILTSIVLEACCIVPAYCFMPDHQHIIITGIQDNSDLWKTIVSYKQKTGFWMSINKFEVKWQKDFYDHVIRKSEDLITQVRYILDNPVRKGLVESWREYPFKGSIGCRIEDILSGMI